MKFNRYFKTLALVLLVLTGATFAARAQATNFPAPRETVLLNGTRVLVWNDSKADKVSVTLRLHSGSAFDPLGKEGTMQLLADILFPTESTTEFFIEDLNGSFEIVTTYDYIQIGMTGDADKLLTILETLAPAVVSPTINKETTERVRAALLTKVKELEKNPSYLADRAVAKRLLGNFPYGRPQTGTPESLAKIDFADLIFARERFLTADNATLTISGKVNFDLASRAARRLFGGWIKADKRIPATFAQPGTPASFSDFVEVPNAGEVQLRQAVRGIARNDKDFTAALIVQKILEARFQSAVGDIPQAQAFVKNQYYLLPGLMVFGGSVPVVNAKVFVENSHRTDFFKPLLPDEFGSAKIAVLNDLSSPQMSGQKLVNRWLDVETFKLASLSEQSKSAAATTIQDAERVLDRFFRKAKFVSVFVGDSNIHQEITKNK